jgi:hypothetical protein
VRRLALTLAAAAVCALAPATALAEPPPNDAYLLATRVDDEGAWPVGVTVDDAVVTTEATVQGDLFAPPHAGGGPEPTRCGDVGYGKTVWYELRTNAPGAVTVRAAGYDTVIAAYRFEPRTTALGPATECRRAQELLLPVAPGRFYAVQIGGVDAGSGPASGQLLASFAFGGDRDRDGVPDERDDCPEQPGGEDGCPPDVRATTRLRGARTADGYRITSLTVRDVRRGDRVAARCLRRCSLRQARTAPVTGALRLPRFRGSVLPPGARMEVRVTRAGATGTWTRFVIRRRGAPRRTSGII